MPQKAGGWPSEAKCVPCATSPTEETVARVGCKARESSSVAGAITQWRIPQVANKQGAITDQGRHEVRESSRGAALEDVDGVSANKWVCESRVFRFRAVVGSNPRTETNIPRAHAPEPSGVLLAIRSQKAGCREDL